MIMPVLQTTIESLTTTLTSWPGVLAVPLLALTVWIVWMRTQDDTDPSQGLVVESDTGALTVNISGAYYVAALVGLVAIVTWPLPVEAPLFGLAHLVLVGAAWWLEKQEAMG